MDQYARYGTRNDGASHFAVPCPPALLTRLSALSAQMEKALAGIANYYGRQKLAPYQHEPKVWPDVRAALLAASDFRQARGRASDDSDIGNPSQTQSGITAE
ncbi:conserved protein of unknown function [Acidithiobacillus ferrivorans]|uniref:Uncharacterized protein n=1 Tax=Acidithiobacillus ferrivorans TaxID=160808 RepID=A0A060UPJ6_9PROT|nr:hypothetical protein [Acidithiobacillus ferrivorans]CDQ10502.1 conserved hypothetical protein [Acidithiobacillus ferrivorans]SMH64532.1 conserved protein of unknown function [Acidithiobacillus ferrivorans]